MNIEVFALCDAATDYGGKLNLLGTFDRISARKFPAVHPQCAIALRLRFTKIEEGEHRIKITLVDEDGQPVFPGLDGKVGIRMAPRDQSVCANLVLNMGNMKFDKPGQYSLDLAVDSRHEKSLPLTLVLVPEKPEKPERKEEPPPSAN
jgi:hypothetical protein